MSIGRMIRRAFMPKPVPSPPSALPAWKVGPESDDAFRGRIIRRAHLIADQANYVDAERLDAIGAMLNVSRWRTNKGEPRG